MPRASVTSSAAVNRPGGPAPCGCSRGPRSPWGRAAQTGRHDGHQTRISRSRRTWLWPAPACVGPAAAPDTAAAPQRPVGKRMARIGAAIAVAGLAAAGIAGRAARAALAASFTVLGHLHWIWIPAAIVLKRRPWPPLRSCCADCSRPAGPASASGRCWPLPMRPTRCRSRCPWPDPSWPPPSPSALQRPRRRCPAGRLVAAGRRGEL
jgi:hypothetical protein